MRNNADWLVPQTSTQGMDVAKAEIIAALQELLSPKGIVERNDAAIERWRSETWPAIKKTVRAIVAYTTLWVG